MVLNAQTLEKCWAGKDQKRNDLKTNPSMLLQKTRRVGPIDNRPSTNKLHHFVWIKKNLRHVTSDMWNMTCDMLWKVNILSKFQLPRFVIYDIWRFGGKGSLTHWINQLQRSLRNSPGYTGSVKYLLFYIVQEKQVTRWTSESTIFSKCYLTFIDINNLDMLFKHFYPDLFLCTSSPKFEN